MAKIDSEELITRIERLDPFYYSGVEMKWLIIKMIKEMEGDNGVERRQDAL